MQLLFKGQMMSEIEDLYSVTLSHRVVQNRYIDHQIRRLDAKVTSCARLQVKPA